MGAESGVLEGPNRTILLGEMQREVLGHDKLKPRMNAEDPVFFQ